MDGGVVTTIALLGLGLGWFALKARARRKVLDWRVGMDMDREEGWKNIMQKKARADGVEPGLHRTVKRLKKRACISGLLETRVGRK